MEQFTLEEARRWLGHTVIAKVDFDADHTHVMAEQQGTVIGVHGARPPHGDPILHLAVQFWLEQDGAVPRVVLVPKREFTEYLCLSKTVE